MSKHAIFMPISKLIQDSSLSERSLSKKINLSRTLIRSIKSRENNITLHSLSEVAKYFDLEVTVLAFNSMQNVSINTVSVSYEVMKDGFESWKIHFLNLVDEFRRTLDPRLILLPPVDSLDEKLKSLLASMVRYLCNEIEIATPEWAQNRYFLNIPWFPSGMESLKATALLESPLEFRNNNIYVQKNFLDRT